MAPRVWRTVASALRPTFGNDRIYQLQPAETESAPNVIRLLSAETECPPKVSIYPHSATKPKPKPKFGRPLVFTDGLKENNKAALAVIFPAKVYSQKLPYGTSIYTAELLAIRAALQYSVSQKIPPLRFSDIFSQNS